jgi:large subunit ribosomal protein L5
MDEVGKKKGKGGGGSPVDAGTKAPPPRLREKFSNEVLSAMMSRFAYKNPMACPRLVKVCLNTGVNCALQSKNQRALEQCVNDMTAISGQKAVITKSRKSISNFRLRQGMQVGCRVTLRGTKMYEFLDRMFNVAMPRIRDFRGITPRCFDGRGNCTIGLAEHTVFPEIDVDKAEVVHGMDVVICTTAKTDEEGRELLKALGLPFRER